MFSKTHSFGANVKVDVDFFNHATKTGLKNSTGVDTSSFTKELV